MNSFKSVELLKKYLSEASEAEIQAICDEVEAENIAGLTTEQYFESSQSLNLYQNYVGSNTAKEVLPDTLLNQKTSIYHFDTKRFMCLAA
jgi:hypothetical protein